MVGYISIYMEGCMCVSFGAKCIINYRYHDVEKQAENTYSAIFTKRLLIKHKHNRTRIQGENKFHFTRVQINYDIGKKKTKLI